MSALQRQIRRMYGAKDEARGDAATFLWLTEEFGELATALRSGSDEELALEMADVLAWLATLANIRGIDLEAAVVRKYGVALPRLPGGSLRLRPGREAVIRSDYPDERPNQDLGEFPMRSDPRKRTRADLSSRRPWRLVALLVLSRAGLPGCGDRASAAAPQRPIDVESLRVGFVAGRPGQPVQAGQVDSALGSAPGGAGAVLGGDGGGRPR